MPRERALPVPADGSKLPRMVGAVIYVRVSTKEQTENLSLPTQLRACEEYCRRQGYKESVLQIWKARKAAVREEIANAERAARAIQDKLDRLDEAFLFERSIDIETYDRHAEKLREELTLARMDRHSGQLDELDVEGILAFAERVLPRAADLWVQASLEQRQRFQQLFFPDGIAFDGKGLLEPRVTAPAFSYLRPIETVNESLVDLTGIEPVTS